MSLSRSSQGHIFRGALSLSAAVVGSLSALIMAFILHVAWPTLSHVGLGSFLSGSWQPSTQSFGLAPLVVGSSLVAVGALVWALPVGVLCALCRRLLMPAWMGVLFDRALEVMFGLPSVVYGLWGLTTLVPLLLKLSPPGQSALAGMTLLGLMVLPTVCLFALKAFDELDGALYQGALALGLTPWAAGRRVLLQAAWPGVLRGGVLALGRALGETMAVLMVCGNLPQLPKTLTEPVRALTANIALEMGYALGDHRGALFVSALALLLTSALIMISAALLDRAGTRILEGRR